MNGGGLGGGTLVSGIDVVRYIPDNHGSCVAILIVAFPRLFCSNAPLAEVNTYTFY